MMMMTAMMIREREISCINIVNSALQLILTGHPRHIHTHKQAHEHSQSDKPIHTERQQIECVRYHSFDSFMFIWFVRSVGRSFGLLVGCSFVR